MKKKNLISLSVSLSFLALAVTGLMLYFGIKPEPVTAIHVLLGLLFAGFAIFHIRNNWASLKVYTKDKKDGGVKKEFLLAAAVVAIFLVGAGFSLPPFGQIQHFGENLTRSGEKRGGFDKISFDNITTNTEKQGTSLSFIIEKNAAVITPVIAIWTEDTTGNFIDNIFVPAKTIEIKPGEADKRHALYEGEIETKNFTPGQLAEWQTKTKDTASNYKEATPTDNFFLKTKTKATGKFQIVMEVKDGTADELYKGAVDLSTTTIVSLKSGNGKILERAITEVK